MKYQEYQLFVEKDSSSLAILEVYVIRNSNKNNFFKSLLFYINRIVQKFFEDYIY